LYFRIFLVYSTTSEPLAQNQASQTPTNEEKSPGFKALSQRILLEKAQGVFLWVALVTGLLNETAYNPHSREEVMDMLSAVPEGLESVYLQSFQKIHTKLKASSQLLLRWVLFARRPLNTIELTYALVCSSPHKSQAVCESSEIFVRSDQMENRIRMLSGGLLETSKVDKTTNNDDRATYSSERVENLRVQFIHESVRDFFLSGDGQIIFGEEVDDDQIIGYSHEILKQSCINYITFEEMSKVNRRYDRSELAKHNEITDLDDRDRCLTGLELARDLKLAYPFLDYAIDSIFYHASRAEAAGISQVSLGRSYLDQADKLFDLWAPLHSIVDIQYHFGSVSTERRLALLELAKYGVISCLRYIQESGTCIDFADRYGITPLQLAAEHGHLNVVQLLIKERNVNSEKDIEAFLAAISKGHLDIAQTLLDSGIDPNMMGYDTTPLKEAILGGHTSFARHLIDRGVNVSARGKEKLYGNYRNLTPLQAAVDKGLEDIVKVLLIKGADPNDRSGSKYPRLIEHYYLGNHGTALVRAAYVGNIQIILTLLDHGADLELCGLITPLQMAIQAGNPRVAKLLLDKGAKIWAGDDDQTVWSFAASRLQDTELFMRLLLDYGADVNFCPDPNSYPWRRYETALATAVRSSNLDGTRFLLDNGAILAGNSDRDGKTVLEIAASNGDLLIFDLLIERGAELQELVNAEVGCLPLAGEFSYYLELGVLQSNPSLKASTWCTYLAHNGIAWKITGMLQGICWLFDYTHLDLLLA